VCVHHRLLTAVAVLCVACAKQLHCAVLLLLALLLLLLQTVTAIVPAVKLLAVAVVAVHALCVRRTMRGVLAHPLLSLTSLARQRKLLLRTRYNVNMSYMKVYLYTRSCVYLSVTALAQHLRCKCITSSAVLQQQLVRSLTLFVPLLIISLCPDHVCAQIVGVSVVLRDRQAPATTSSSSSSSSGTVAQRQLEVLLLKRPATGLLAGQWECPSTVLLSSDAAADTAAAANAATITTATANITTTATAAAAATASSSSKSSAKGKAKASAKGSTAAAAAAALQQVELQRAAAATELLETELKLSAAALSSRRSVGTLVHIFSHRRHTMLVERVNYDCSAVADSSSSSNSSSGVVSSSSSMTVSGREARWMTESEMKTVGITTGMKKVLALALADISSVADAKVAAATNSSSAKSSSKRKAAPKKSTAAAAATAKRKQATAVAPAAVVAAVDTAETVVAVLAADSKAAIAAKPSSSNKRPRRTKS
jgi:adenine-specific DNA glycosylase